MFQTTNRYQMCYPSPKYQHVGDPLHQTQTGTNKAIASASAESSPQGSDPIVISHLKRTHLYDFDGNFRASAASITNIYLFFRHLFGNSPKNSTGWWFEPI